MSDLEALLELRILSLRRFVLEIKCGPSFQMFPGAFALGTRGTVDGPLGVTHGPQ